MTRKRPASWTAAMLPLLIGLGIAWQHGMVQLVTRLAAMRSTPFDPPERGRIAITIITATGMRMTAARIVGEFQP